MTDLGIVFKKIARIEACLHDLAGVDVDRLGGDIVVDRFVERTLQVAIQAAIDVAAHIVADERLGDAGSSHQLFERLAERGWISGDSLPVLHRIVGFRNILVHDYDEVDPEIVQRVVRHHLVDLQRFADQIRLRLVPPPSE